MVENKIHIPLVWTHLHDKTKTQHVCEESRIYINAASYIANYHTQTESIIFQSWRSKSKFILGRKASLFLTLLINYIDLNYLISDIISPVITETWTLRKIRHIFFNLDFKQGHNCILYSKWFQLLHEIPVYLTKGADKMISLDF